MTTVEVQPGGPLRGRLRVPGDKSISHRAFLLSALAEGTSTIEGLSTGEDVARTCQAIEAMGAIVAESAKADKSFETSMGKLPGRSFGKSLEIQGGRSRLREPESVVDLGNSGTGMRLLAGWCAALPWLSVLIGDESLHRRPMQRVADPLRLMGAQIDGRGEGRWPPLVIRGGRLHGIDYCPPYKSAQVKSAVLLAGLVAEGGTVVHEPVATRAHTEEMLAMAGADITVDEHGDGGITVSVQPSDLRPFSLRVPGDPSQAAFWMVGAAIVPGSDITLERVYVGPGRAGAIDVLVRMGADIDLSHHDAATADVRVRHSVLHATEISGDEIPALIDELPVLAVAAAMAKGRTMVANADEMRIKESDRITTTTTELRKLGVKIEERPDGFVVDGSPGKILLSATIASHLDHRIAMTGAIAALCGSGSTHIEGWESVATSYPAFLDDLAQLRGTVS